MYLQSIPLVIILERSEINDVINERQKRILDECQKRILDECVEKL